ncbi:MAG: hypothetical protein HXK22_03690 [Alloprevotella tannerae]|nr:hypothetical protein [Alloprevotella tannerae]
MLLSLCSILRREHPLAADPFLLIYGLAAANHRLPRPNHRLPAAYYRLVGANDTWVGLNEEIKRFLL